MLGQRNATRTDCAHTRRHIQPILVEWRRQNEILDPIALHRQPQVVAQDLLDVSIDQARVPDTRAAAPAGGS